MEDPNFPPRNRQDRCLPALQIEIVHAAGVETYDPNGVLLMAYSNPHHFLEMPHLDDRISVLSGGSAVSYRSADLEIPLAPAELYELVCYNLPPHQVQTLGDVYGSFFEIHDDFYDVQTLEALQPLHKR